MRDSRKKITTLALGFSAGLVLLEIFLRIIGWAHLSQTTRGSDPAGDKNGQVILCLGDSFTFGNGASRERSYPRQLEEIFRRRHQDAGVNVVNRGIGGSNTARIVGAFERFVRKTDPDLVIVLMGGNNFWNPYGYKHYLHQQTLGYRLQDYLCRVKTFKLAKLLFLDIRNRLAASRRLKASGPEGTKRPPGFDLWYAKAVDCEQEGRYEEAILWHKKIIAEMPDNAHSYNSIGRMYCLLGKREESKPFFKKSIELAPRDPYCYTEFAGNLITEAEDDEALKFLKARRHVNTVIDDILKQLSNQQRYRQDIRQWVASDMAAIIRMARDRGIKILMQSYPDFGGKAETAVINAILEDIAREHGVPFLDHNSAFQELWSREGRKGDYFAFDQWHCNAKGYGVMAENLYHYILEHGLLD